MRGRGRGKVVGAARRRQFFDQRAAGIAQAEEPGHFVKGLPGGVIPAPAQEFHFQKAVYQVEVGVAAGNHQGHQGEGRRLLGEKGRQDMGPEVVDPGQRQALPEGQGLGHGHADHQGADEPGPLGHGQAVQVLKRHSGLVQGRLDHRQNVLQVPPGRQLRHHPAVGGVQLELGGHHRGEDAPAVRHYCGRGLIAGSLYPQDQHFFQWRAATLSELSEMTR